MRETNRQSAKQNVLALAVSAAIASLFSSSSLAQSNDENQVLEEVLVTAQKRAQRIEEIPQSLQLLGENTLVESAIRDVSELFTFVPGASEGLNTNVGQRRLQIRGIYQENGSATVGYYLDEAPIDGDGAAPMGRLYDMQQVEILRGPQSTLWGNGAMGGVVRYIPNQPDLTEVRGGLRTGYSGTKDGDDGYYGDAFFSAPIIEDKLGLRVVASREQLGGWIDIAGGPEDFNEAELTDLRAHLLWEPSDNWRARLMYSNNEADQNGSLLLSGFFPDDTISSGSSDDFYTTEMEVWSGVVEYKGFESFDIVTIVSSVEYAQDNGIRLVLPGLSTVTGLFATEIDTLSTETRLVSKGEGAFQWMVGTYLTDRETSRADVLNWDPEIPPFFVNSDVATIDNRESIAFFGEFSWSLMDGKLVPLVGIRWAEEEFDGDSAVAAGVTGTQSFDTTNLRFNLSWFPTDNAHYYLNVAEGFRSGFFNQVATCATHNLLLVEGQCEVVQESDELISYEVGAKYSLMDGRLLIESALYFIDWQRTPQQIPVGGLFQTYNVGDSEIYGFDFSLAYQPAAIDGLSISFVGNYLSAEFANVNTFVAASLVPPFETQSVGPEDGQALPFVPEYTATFSIDYGRAIGAGWNGLANFSWNHLDGQFGQFGANTDRGDSRDLVRLRIGVEKDNLGVFLFGRNLLDEDGEIFSQAPTDGVPLFTRDYPRQIGVELTYNFN
ncbi:MAG: TonB-dependent receptor [Congregibacter sp.]